VKTRRKTLAVFAGVGLLVVTVVMSCSELDKVIIAPPDTIPGAKYVGMDQCALCHEKLVKRFKTSAHARFAIPGPNDCVPAQGCESCHGPGSLHIEHGAPDKFGGHIINPSKKPEACFRCHVDKQAEFNLPYHHPVREGKMSCTDCHDPHGDDMKKGKGVLIARTNDACAQCHREQTRPRVFQHEALKDGCTVCHNVHGSINQKMLVENDNNLCLKCHAEVVNTAHARIRTVAIAGGSHSGRVNAGPCWSAGCHTAMHGSNIQHYFRY